MICTDHKTALKKKGHRGEKNYLTCKSSFQYTKINLFMKKNFAQNHVNECRHPFIIFIFIDYFANIFTNTIFYIFIKAVDPC